MFWIILEVLFQWTFDLGIVKFEYFKHIFVVMTSMGIEFFFANIKFWCLTKSHLVKHLDASIFWSVIIKIPRI